MAETRNAKTAGPRNRRSVTSAYRRIADRYADVEALSLRAHELLASREAIAEVRAVLERKQALLGEIRREEARVSLDLGAGEKSGSPDLAAILDEISRRIERSLALEAECRALLESSMTAPAGPARVSRGGVR